MGLNSGTVTNSYWDTESSGQTTSGGGTGYTGVELREPTSYTGIYATWDDHDIDGDGNADSPWDFGQDYNYPKLSGRGGQWGPRPVRNMTVTRRNEAPNRRVSWDPSIAERRRQHNRI